MKRPADLVAEYVEWLKKNIAVQETDGWVQITTPFLDRHNDHLQIYVKAEGNQYVLTDDGYILSDLELSGYDISTPQRERLLKTQLAGFGVQVEDQALVIRASPGDFAQKKHALLQAMLAVNDLFLTARPVVRGLFLEEVGQFLVKHRIRYVPAVHLTGRSGLSHRFDYVIPAWDEAPERLVATINNPTREKVTSALFAWTDIREVRSSRVAMYAVMNDSERTIPRSLAQACTNSGVQVVPWSRRQEYVAELQA